MQALFWIFAAGLIVWFLWLVSCRPDTAKMLFDENRRIQENTNRALGAAAKGGGKLLFWWLRHRR
jgi:uncharacterized protein YjeT (DUF2065 family)